MSRNSKGVGSSLFPDHMFVRDLSKAFSMMLALLPILTACQPAAQEHGRPLHANVAQAVVNSPSSTWKKGMAYADFRIVAAAAGWSAVIDPQCNANVVGDNYASLCSAHAELDDCRVCEDIPELSACSGDGYCGMTFSKQAQELEVTTYGMTEDRKIMGEKSRLQVVGWTIETKKP